MTNCSHPLFCRVHFIAKLKAIDTSEKDRALADLEKERSTNRELTLR